MLIQTYPSKIQGITRSWILWIQTHIEPMRHIREDDVAYMSTWTNCYLFNKRVNEYVPLFENTGITESIVGQCHAIGTCHVLRPFVFLWEVAPTHPWETWMVETPRFIIVPVCRSITLEINDTVVILPKMKPTFIDLTDCDKGTIKHRCQRRAERIQENEDRILDSGNTSDSNDAVCNARNQNVNVETRQFFPTQGLIVYPIE